MEAGKLYRKLACDLSNFRNLELDDVTIDWTRRFGVPLEHSLGLAENLRQLIFYALKDHRTGLDRLGLVVRIARMFFVDRRELEIQLHLTLPNRDGLNGRIVKLKQVNL